MAALLFEPAARSCRAEHTMPDPDIIIKPRDVMPAGARHAAGGVLHRSARTSGPRWTGCSRGSGSAPAVSEQVARPGQYFVREVLGESIIITRRRPAHVQAFYNVCRHRGTRSVHEATGQFAGSIQCPYHAWTYGLDGRLLGAPHMDEVPHFDKADYPLHRVAGGRLGRAHLHLDCAEIRRRSFEQLADLAAQVHQLAHAGPPARPPHRLRRPGQLEADHPELQRVPALPEPASGAEQALALSERRERAAARRPTWAAGWICGPASTTMSMDGTCPRAILPGLSADERRRVYYYAIFPNMLLSLHPDYMMVHTLWPIAPDRTINICEWHFHPPSWRARASTPRT